MAKKPTYNRLKQKFTDNMKGVSTEKMFFFRIPAIFAVIFFFLYPSIPVFALELSADEKAYLRSKGTIIFVSQTRYPPFEFVDKNDEHTGMCIELSRWMATEFGFTARFTDTYFKQAQQDILSERADVLTSLFYSKKRDESFDFTQVMFEVPASIFVVAERTDIKDIQDLNGKRIAMQTGDYAKEFLESKKVEFDVVYAKNFAEATDLVIAGKADAIIGDEQIVLYHIFKDNLTDKIKKIGAPLYIGQNCMATKEANRMLISILNKGIKIAQQSGILEKINRKWIGTHYKMQESLLSKYFTHLSVAAGAILLLTLLIWFWNIQLRQAVRERTEKLRESDERFRLAFDNAASGIALVANDGYFMKVNQTLCRIIGYSEEELLGKTWVEITSPDDLDGCFDWLNRVKSGEQSAYEKRFIHKLGHPVWVMVSSSLVRDSQGRIRYYISLFQDVNDRKKLETELQQAQKMESLGLMAGGIAHDLNNILSGIVSYPDLLLMDLPEDSPIRKPVETIKESGQRAADVVSDLLTVARGVATGKEVLNLNTIIEEYISSAEHKKIESLKPSINYKTQFESDLLYISCSSSHIKKCLLNLVVNASESIEGGGDVTISTMNRYLDDPLTGYEVVRKGEYTTLTVSDNGSGISPDDLERIFEPFYTKKIMGRSGTGLGLAVVWNTVQDHEGYINVKSSEKGTTFELYFPITRDELTTEKDLTPFEEYVGHGESILVVDDEENQRKIACELLARLGYIAEAVSSGEEAIEYLMEHSVDLIVLDMIMPKGMNGRETYEEAKKIYHNQKAIIASGYAETKDVKETQKLGAGKYIKKPYTLVKIGIAVRDELKK